MKDHLLDHQKFGYASVMEKVAIRERLLAEGHADDGALFFAVEKAFVAAHANDPTYRERQLAWQARCRALYPPRASILFTEEELAHLAEHFMGANDPTAQAIFAKVTDGLANMSASEPLPKRTRG